VLDVDQAELAVHELDVPRLAPPLEVDLAIAQEAASHTKILPELARRDGVESHRAQRRGPVPPQKDPPRRESVDGRIEWAVIAMRVLAIDTPPIRMRFVLTAASVSTA
jgi:hypothetical protein